MKYGMHVLSPYQVACLRMISAGVVLLPFSYRAFKQIPKENRGLIFISGLLGSFFPAFLFCIAETKITSTLAGILNALTPLFTISLGIAFYKMKVSRLKTIGVLIGFFGLCLLPFAAGKSIGFQNVSYSLYAIIATVMYGINVNLVSHKLKHLPSIQIASLAFSFLLIPSLIILYFTGYFADTDKIMSVSTLASCVLGIGGTAIATILFYRLIKIAGSLLASLVTYGIPFVALFWGLLEGEPVSVWEIACLFIILSGVWLVNKK
jgi:drug/metabolite transporter (DMT)-like permease